jgi:hypothetical protein
MYGNTDEMTMVRPRLILEYVPTPQIRRILGMSAKVWCALGLMSCLIEFLGDFGTGGRISGIGDIVFIVSFAAAAFISFWNAFWLTMGGVSSIRRRGKQE